MEELSLRLASVRGEEELKKLVKIQVDLKNFINDITSNFSMTVFAQGMISTVVFCSTSFALTTVSCVCFHSIAVI